VFGTCGVFWQDESSDHVVRDDDELLGIICYIEQNPVKARLVGQPEAWRWSSATDRALRGVVPGEPLLK
jgi:putative DNA methylase